MQHEINLIDEDNFKFDNLPDRPEKPTSQEIASLINPIPSGVNENAGCPTGMVGTFFGTTAPAGWLICDGTKYNRTDYPSLFNHLLNQFSSTIRAEWGDADWVDEFNVPNLQGEFPRFAGINSHANQGNGDVVGVHQDATEIPYIHSNYNQNNKGLINFRQANATNWNMIKNADSDIGTQRNTISVYSDTQNGSTNGAYAETTRPTNTSFLPIIKY